ncbi:beta-propeller fold lactonase family protein [Microbacterium chocolatum]|uniref:lactonase family protein n=1 Tax=Microbacterium aurantiacum TaxID=162393 RepID=UPI00338E594F
MRFLVGGYTAPEGSATGIAVLDAGAPDDALAGGLLRGEGDAVAVTGSPSWITPHPTLDVVYAALEGAGTVQAFRRVGPDRLAPHGVAVPAGDAVCHVAVSPDGAFLLASCWGDGRVVQIRLDAAGVPSRPIDAADPRDPYGSTEPHAGADAVPGGSNEVIDLAAAARALREAAGAEYAHLVPEHDRDEAREPAAPEEASADTARTPHAHQARFLPRGLVATTDMGYDVVRLWSVTSEGLRHRQDVVLPRGSGPRHTVWHPSGHLYVVTELSHEVFVLAPDVTGAWHVVAGTSLGVGILPDDTAAELAMSHDAETLYAGVRGTDTIAVLRVRGGGEALSPVALVEADVRWPRHHLVVRDRLLVAGQHSDDVVSRPLDPRTGIPGRVRHRAPVASPSCLLPLR